MHSMVDSLAYRSDIVLVGGGHAHALVLLKWLMRPLREARVTLISEQGKSPYSGMLPGVVAGHYSDDEIHIDLRRLCVLAGVRFLQARVTGIDAATKRVLLEGRPPVEYDVLSINAGITPDVSVPGAAAHAVPVKPISTFLPRWRQVQAELETAVSPCTVTVVGGGAGSVELVLAMAYRLRHSTVQHEWLLITRSASLLPDYPLRMRQQLQKRLALYRIRVLTATTVVGVNAEAVVTAAGATIASRHVFWCTQASAPAWLAKSGLAVSPQGYLAINDALQSESHPEVFGAGDCAWQSAHALPRAGVYAVRQAPVLADNLTRYIRKQLLRPYRPQRNFLSLLACGGYDAVGAKGHISVAGRWVWCWKDRIDRRFMYMFQRLPAQAPLALRDDAPVAAGERCGGCGGKVSGDVLRRALSTLDATRGAASACALAPAEDAAIITIPGVTGDNGCPDGPNGTVLVQSVDAVKPLFDDPWRFARIATVHALSDVYAMQAKPHSAQLLLQLPAQRERLLQRDITQVLQGVDGVLAEHGATLVGGHSVEAESMQVGLAVNAFALSSSLVRKRGAQVGDVLLLTKPVGTGVLFAAAMRGYLQAVWIDAAIASMEASNAEAVEVFRHVGVHALTDVTGFGVAGHLQEMLGPTLGACLDMAAIPVLAGAQECWRRGYQSTLAPANRRQVQAWLTAGTNATEDTRYAPLFDPQTSGGLLAAVAPADAECCRQMLQARGIPAARIGVCTPTGRLDITFNTP